MKEESFMCQPKSRSNLSALPAIVLLCTLNGCGNNSTEPITEMELVGQWEATEIQGAVDGMGNPLPINGSVSTWTFHSNGTYEWFLHAQPIFNFDGNGSYSLNGNILTVSGIIANTLFSETPGNEDEISLTFGKETLSFRDEDGDRWSYRKISN